MAIKKALNRKKVIDKYADKWADENCICYDKSIENLARAAYIAGSDTMLDIVCKWLENNATKYDATTDTFHSTVDIKALRRYLDKGV